MTNEPRVKTMAEAVRLIRHKKLSPVELLESCLRMIDRLEPRIQAWVTLDREGAMREAHKLAEAARNGDWRGVLHGIPVGVKDIFCTAGMRTTAGHSATVDFVPNFDSAVAER